jgi:hypothetical protein
MLLAPALLSLRWMVQQLLMRSRPPAAHGNDAARQPGAAAGGAYVGVQGRGAGVCDADIDVGVSAERLGRVVCAWLQDLSDMHEILARTPPVPSTVAAAGGGEVASARPASLLAHLVYVSVLWCVGPGGSHVGDEPHVGDELQAALLSGMLPSYHPTHAPCLHAPCHLPWCRPPTRSRQ